MGWFVKGPEVVFIEKRTEVTPAPEQIWTLPTREAIAYLEVLKEIQNKKINRCDPFLLNNAKNRPKLTFLPASRFHASQLEELMKRVATHFEIEENDLKSSSKRKQVVKAKSAFGYLAIKKMGYTGREVGSFLNMRSYSAIRRALEGQKVIDNRVDMWGISRIVE